LWTLEQGLGPAFDDDTRQAWTLAYQTLAGVMLEAAEQAEPAAAA
jgi:hemoglobin-like flavoprotein